MTPPAACAVAGCGSVHSARGLCARHYGYFWRRNQLGEAGLTVAAELLPNPWARVAPRCPEGHDPAEVYLWARGPLAWYCMGCRRRFDGADEQALAGESDRLAG